MIALGAAGDGGGDGKVGKKGKHAVEAHRLDVLYEYAEDGNSQGHSHGYKLAQHSNREKTYRK